MNRPAALSAALSALLLMVVVVAALMPERPERAEPTETPPPDSADGKMVPRSAVPVVLPAPPPPPSPKPLVRETAPTVQVAAKPDTAAQAPPERNAPETGTTARGTVQKVDAEVVADGRVLLHLIAEGKGPSIEIAWPDAASERADLYRQLAACHGLKTILVGEDGTLYAVDGTAGRPWRFNRDAYSPFMRVVSGPLTPTERKPVAGLRERHGTTGNVARIFPRVVDAGVVGALFRLAGKAGQEQIEISARYGLDRHGVFIGDIAVDGKGIAGVLRMPAVRGGC